MPMKIILIVGAVLLVVHVGIAIYLERVDKEFLEAEEKEWE